MVGKKKKDPFCRDTLNTLAKIDKEIHWFREYNWYSNICVEDESMNKINLPKE